MREVRKLVWGVMLIGWILFARAEDQLVFENGDIVTGKYLGSTDSLIFFESKYFGTLKVPTSVAELRLEALPLVAENALPQEPLPSPVAPAFVATMPGPDVSSDELPESLSLEEHLSQPVIVEEENGGSALGFLWDSAEKTLNRFVHDRVPDWFPQLPENWKGQLNLGYNYNEAVKASTRYYGDLSVEGDLPKTNYLLKSHFAYAQQDKTRSEHDWGVSARYRHKLTRSTDFFETLATHDVDELFEPRNRTTTSVGFGIKPYDVEKLKLDTVLGGALERIDRRDTDAESSFKLNFNENLQWKFNKQLTLKQSLRFYLTPDDALDYYYRFESGIDALIVGAFNLGLSYRLDYDSAVDDKDARQKTRIVTSVGVKF